MLRPVDSTSVNVPQERRQTTFAGWVPEAGAFCKECGGLMYREPDGAMRRGCPACGFTTIYPDRHFGPMKPKTSA